MIERIRLAWQQPSPTRTLAPGVRGPGLATSESRQSEIIRTEVSRISSQKEDGHYPDCYIEGCLIGAR
jgi:hypothetical protein